MSFDDYTVIGLGIIVICFSLKILIKGLIWKMKKILAYH